MEPKIRFKGFEEEWRKTKYSSFATIRRGLTYSPENIASKGIRVLRSSNIDEDVFIRSEEDVFVHSSCINIPLAKDGDILITAANGSPRLVGKHAVINNLNEDKVVPGGFMILASSKEPYFLNSCMGAPWYKTFLKTGVAGGNGAIGNLNKNTLEEYEFYTPSNKLERDEIASYFTTLDAQISASTFRLASLRQTKAASLQAMFPQEGETMPKVRFKGFDGEWKKVSFKDFTFHAGTKNRDNLPLESYSISNEFGFIPQNEQFENGGTMTQADKRMYYIVSSNSFAYNPARINVGSLGYYEGNEDVIVSSLYEVFKTDDTICDRFLLYWFKTNIFQKMIEQFQEGGVRLYFFYDKMCKCSLKRPSLAEQQAIASYFTSLDHQISLQAQRLEKLKQIKAACLEKMFV